MPELPGLYQITVDHDGLEIVGMALSQIRAKVSMNLPELFNQINAMQEKIVDMGGQTFADNLQGIIDQIAKLDGIPQCPDCGHYHPPKEGP